ncbi:PA2779 family protein [Sideroxydans sp.]
MNNRFMRITSRFLIATVLSFSLPIQAAYAGMIGVDQIAQSEQSQNQRDRIKSFLDREDVVKAMQAEGLDASTAKSRVDALTDQEVQQVAGKIDTLPAGGDILGILFTVFIVLLLTDILGVTKVFPFTRSVR